MVRAPRPGLASLGGATLGGGAPAAVPAAWLQVLLHTHHRHGGRRDVQVATPGTRLSRAEGERVVTQESGERQRRADLLETVVVDVRIVEHLDPPIGGRSRGRLAVEAQPEDEGAVGNERRIGARRHHAGVRVLEPEARRRDRYYGI